MKNITKQMIEIYNLNKLGIDFMGYDKDYEDKFTYHHLVIPKALEGPKIIENGAILVRRSHKYLHLIEGIDEEVFFDITSELIDINIKLYVDRKNIKKIHSILEYFEREHCSDLNRHGEAVIKEEYVRRRIR